MLTVGRNEARDVGFAGEYTCRHPLAECPTMEPADARRPSVSIDMPMVRSVRQRVRERDETIASAPHHCRQIVEAVRIQSACMEQKHLWQFLTKDRARLRFVEAEYGVDVADIVSPDQPCRRGITQREHRIIDASEGIVVVVDGYRSDHVAVPLQEPVKYPLLFDTAPRMEKRVSKVQQFPAMLRHQRARDPFPKEHVTLEIAEPFLVQALMGECMVAQIEAGLEPLLEQAHAGGIEPAADVQLPLVDKSDRRHLLFHEHGDQITHHPRDGTRAQPRRIAGQIVEGDGYVAMRSRYLKNKKEKRPRHGRGPRDLLRGVMVSGTHHSGERSR